MSIGIKEPDENSTIEEHFQHYLNRSFTGRQLSFMSNVQRNEMRKCFFGGMASFSVVGGISGVRLKLMEQLKVFWGREMTKYQSDNN